MNIHFSYSLSNDVVQHGVKRYWMHQHFRKTEFMLSCVFIIILAVFIAWNGLQSLPTALVVGGVVLLFWLLDYLQFKVLLRGKLSASKALGAAKTDWRLTDASLEFVRAGQKTEFRWSQLKTVFSDDRVVILVWGKLDFSIIPLDALPIGVIQQIQGRVGRYEPGT